MEWRLLFPLRAWEAEGENSANLFPVDSILISDAHKSHSEKKTKEEGGFSFRAYTWYLPYLLHPDFGVGTEAYKLKYVDASIPIPILGLAIDIILFAPAGSGRWHSDILPNFFLVSSVRIRSDPEFFPCIVGCSCRQSMHSCSCNCNTYCNYPHLYVNVGSTYYHYQ
jgi:hypothetical protein